MAKHVTGLEEGELFFFYRPRPDTDHVEDLEDIAWFFMITATQRGSERHFRVFVLGRKRLPELARGRAVPGEREWALNVLTTKHAAAVRKELGAVLYRTRTRGEQTAPAAVAVAEARYRLVRHRDHSELAYVLELPRRPGPAQEEFEIHDEASYVVAVHNPDVPPLTGIPNLRVRSAYPPRLLDKFGKKHWIFVDDVELLDYDGALMLLIGAHAGADLQEELGIHLEPVHETLASAEVLRFLRLRRVEAPIRPLFEGEFPEQNP